MGEKSKLVLIILAVLIPYVLAVTDKMAALYSLKGKLNLFH